MQSVITGDYIFFGSCETYSQKLNNHKSWTGNNQIQVVSRSTPEDKEVQTPTLNEITVKDVSFMEVQQDSD